MGEACGMCGREEKHIKDLVGEPEGKNQLDRLDIDGLLMLKCIAEI